MNVAPAFVAAAIVVGSVLALITIARAQALLLDLQELGLRARRGRASGHRRAGLTREQSDLRINSRYSAVTADETRESLAKRRDPSGVTIQFETGGAGGGGGAKGGMIRPASEDHSFELNKCVRHFDWTAVPSLLSPRQVHAFVHVNAVARKVLWKTD